MKCDGRTLDHGTLEIIRKMAVERVREGERPSEVIASYGFHRCTIYGWLKASRPVTGRPRALSAAQERQGKLTVHYLPGYAPDLNPDELVWSYAKRTGHARRPLQQGEKLETRVTEQLAEIGRRPDLVRSFFRHPSVAYISDC